MVLLEVDVAETCGDSRARMHVASRVECRDRHFEVRPRIVETAADERHPTCALVERRSGGRIVSQLQGQFEVSLSRLGRLERGGAVTGADDQLPGLGFQLAGIGGFRRDPVRLEVMGRRELDVFVVVSRADLEQVVSDGEVLLLTVALRERLVGDCTDEVLKEDVLAAFW